MERIGDDIGRKDKSIVFVCWAETGALICDQ